MTPFNYLLLSTKSLKNVKNILWTRQLPLSLLLGGADARVLEILEEFRIRVHHHQIATVLETGAIRFEATIELVKLGIPAECLRIDLRRLGIALTAHIFRVTIGFSQNHRALLVGIGTNFFRLGKSG